MASGSASGYLIASLMMIFSGSGGLGEKGKVTNRCPMCRSTSVTTYSLPNTLCCGTYT
jgi:hypothetical protein